jgi:phosphoserine phosphatase
VVVVVLLETKAITHCHTTHEAANCFCLWEEAARRFCSGDEVAKCEEAAKSEKQRLFHEKLQQRVRPSTSVDLQRLVKRESLAMVEVGLNITVAAHHQILDIL